MAAVKKLRTWLAEKDNIVVCPGVYDGFTARIALSVGFKCLYMVIMFSGHDPLETARECWTVERCKTYANL